MTRLIIGMLGGLFALDADEPGTPRVLLDGVQPVSLAVDPSSPSRIYCATYNRGLWRSEDAGETWRPKGTPQNFFRPHTAGAIGPRETTSVSVEPTADATGRHAVWVGTEPSRLYRSTDHAETFEMIAPLDVPSRKHWSFPPRPQTHHVQCVAHGDDGSMHVAIEFGAMLRSRDGGKTFADRRPDSPLDTHALATHPAAPGRLYAALGDALITRGRSFAESRDGGESWQYSGRGLERMPYLYGLAVNSGDPDDIRVAASPGPQEAHFRGGSSIFRRDTDGWVEDAEGFPIDHSLVPVLGADPTRPGRWFAVSNLGLFKKEPADARWTLLAAPDAWRDMNPMSLAICSS